MDHLTTFLILLLAVPLQYYILGFSPLQYLLVKTFSLLPQSSGDTCFSYWIAGVVWMTQALFRLDSLTLGEVLVHSPRNDYGHVVIQIDRPEGLLYKVGDVLEHRMEGTRGVVIAWGMELSESEESFAVVYVYTVLLDLPDEEHETDYDFMVGQFFQQDIQKITEYMTSSPILHVYFEAFDGKKFLPKKWLKRAFPNG